MELLNALLAFSVAMLVFSTMSMVLVELIYRASRTRELYFNRMIGALFNELIAPRLLQNTYDNMESVKDDFVAIMVSVSGLRSLDLGKAAGQETLSGRLLENKGKGLFRPLWTMWNAIARRLLSHRPKTTERLTAVEFAQRFARTQAGKALMKHGEDSAKAVVRDLAAQLNTVSSGASSDFKQRSLKLSLIAASILTLVLNIDSIYLFKRFSNDHALAEKVIEFGEQNKLALQSRADSIGTQLEESDMSPVARQGLQKLLEDTQAELHSIQQTSATLTDMGVPFGREYFPYCKPLPVSSSGSDKGASLYQDMRCVGQDISIFSRAGVMWLVGILLSIVLIAQGSPFWFQMFQKLSVVLQMLRTMGIGKTGDQATRNQTLQAEDASPQKAVDIFMSTMKAEQLEHLVVQQSQALHKESTDS